MKRMAQFVVLFLGAITLLMAPVMARGGKSSDVSRYGRTLLERINAYRVENGLNRLVFDSNMVDLAKHHSASMFEHKQLDHFDFEERFVNAGSHMCVENVGWNYSSSLAQFNAWHQSSSHDQNMLAYGLHKAGIAEIGGYVTFFACQ